jgi:hypothetical protein
MGALSWLFGGNDRALADTHYTGHESASDRAARRRSESHRARVIRDGDASGKKMPRRYRKHNG